MIIILTFNTNKYVLIWLEYFISQIKLAIIKSPNRSRVYTAGYILKAAMNSPLKSKAVAL